MKRKKKDTFDAAGLKELERRLIEHRDSLVIKIRELSDAPDFESATDCRDAATQLTMCCMVLKSLLPTSISLCEMTGQPQSVPYLEECELPEPVTT